MNIANKSDSIDYWFATIVDLVVKSKKSRLFDWACHAYPRGIDGTPREFVWYLENLEENLKEKDFMACLNSIQHVFYISRHNAENKKSNRKASNKKSSNKSDKTPSKKTNKKPNKKPNKKLKFRVVSNEVFQKLKRQFRVPPIVKKFDNIAAQLWLPILGVIHRDIVFYDPEDPILKQMENVQLLVDRLYNLSLKRHDRIKFRYQDSSKLFLIQAVYAICFPREVVRTWYMDNNIDLHDELDDKDILLERLRLTKISKYAKGIPFHAIDCHTDWGRQLKRGKEFFILHGARLRHTVPELRFMEKRLLDMTIKEWKEFSYIDKDFSISDDYLIEDCKTESRYKMPEIPNDWDTVKHPRDQMYNATQRGFYYFLCQEASSAMQKAVRRCEDEALQWAINNFWTGKAWRTNVLKRCLVICSEDIGPANLSLILLVEDIIDLILENE